MQLEKIIPSILPAVFGMFIYYNYRINLKLKYRSSLEGRFKLLILFIGLFFIYLAYKGGHRFMNYLSSLLALGFVYSGLAWQGLSSQGIYYRSRGFLIRHITWEEVIDFKIEKDRLKSLRVRKINIYRSSI